MQKPYISQKEDETQELQLQPLGKISNELAKLLIEYKARKSLESQVVKDADNLEYVLSLKELELKGNYEAKRRLNSENTSNKLLFHPTSKKLWKIIMSTDPTEWTRTDLVKTFRQYSTQTKNRGVQK